MKFMPVGTLASSGSLLKRRPAIEAAASGRNADPAASLRLKKVSDIVRT